MFSIILFLSSDAQVYDNASQISAKTLFMYETLADKAAVLDSTVSYLGDQLLQKHKLGTPANHCKASQVKWRVSIPSYTYKVAEVLYSFLKEKN